MSSLEVLEIANGRQLIAQAPWGSLRFLVCRTPAGVVVEREELPHHGTRTSIALLFANAADFDRWCDDDPVRFQHPLLHQALQRAREIFLLAAPA